MRARAGQVFGMINNKMLSHGSMLYQDDWRSPLFNLVRMHFPVFAGWGLNPSETTADLAFPDDDGVFTKVLIAHGYLDAQIWADRHPIYLIDVKTSLTDRCDDFFLTDVQHKRVSRLPPPGGGQAIGLLTASQMTNNTHPSPMGMDRATIYMIMRVTNIQQMDIKVQIHVDPAAELRHTHIWVASVPRSLQQ